MMRQVQLGFIPDRPAVLPGPLAKIDILVIEEKAGIKAAELLQALAANEQAAAGEPRHLQALRRIQWLALAPRTRLQQPEKRAPKRGVFADRTLRRAVWVFEAKADDARGRILRLNFIGQFNRPVEKALGHRHIGIQDQEPFAPAEAAAFIHAARKATIAVKATQ